MFKVVCVSSEIPEVFHAGELYSADVLSFADAPIIVFAIGRAPTIIHPDTGCSLIGPKTRFERAMTPVQIRRLVQVDISHLPSSMLCHFNDIIPAKGDEAAFMGFTARRTFSGVILGVTDNGSSFVDGLKRMGGYDDATRMWHDLLDEHKAHFIEFMEHGPVYDQWHVYT